MNLSVEFSEPLEIEVSVADNSSSIALDFGTVSRIEASAEDYPYYQGAYTVTPSDEAQTLATKNTTMTDDVTVKQIPYYEVSNQTGSTVYIGKEL